jgi:hypothetical protein
MARLSRQVPATDLNTLLSLLTALVYLVIGGLILYWFYNILKRIERTLAEIKKVLESKASTAT